MEHRFAWTFLLFYLLIKYNRERRMAKRLGFSNITDLRVNPRGFIYSTPLAGTRFIRGLDNRKRISINPPTYGAKNKPCSVRDCAGKFRPLHISQLSRQDPETFNAIADCYREAYLLGNIEAGNNLGILYFNYAGRHDEGLDIFRACAKNWNAHAIINCFSAIWGDGDRKAATEFALSAPILPVPLCWVLAILYLRGQDIEGNPLPSDRGKGIVLLRKIINKEALSVGNARERARRRKKAKFLLAILDGKTFI